MVQKLLVLKLEPDLDLEPDTLSEHGGAELYVENCYC